MKYNLYVTDSLDDAMHRVGEKANIRPKSKDGILHLVLMAIITLYSREVVSINALEILFEGAAYDIGGLYIWVEEVE